MLSSIGISNLKVRLICFALAVVTGLAFAAWLQWGVQRQARNLQKEMEAVRTESFYIGVHLRAGIWRLDGRLLRFQLSDDEKEREGFLRESRELGEQIQQVKPHLITADELKLLGQVETAFQVYLDNAAPLLERGIRGIRRDTTEQLARTIAERSAQVLQLCDNLMQANHAAWESVLTQSDHSVAGLIKVMHFSTVLTLCLIIGILILAYRTFIAPLQNQLHATTAVIQRQEKLASLGAFAAGVAHEIRNPLAAMKFRLFSLKDSLSSGSADTEDVRVIGEELDRLDRIVKDFLHFARPSEPEMTRVSAAALLQNLHELLRDQFEKQAIHLVVESEDDIWVRADKEQIKQVLINLLQNAAESLAGKGAVTLRARQGVARLVATGSQPVVILEVSDTGAGIPSEIEGRLFDPFFSTKRGGTGLGLSIAARIVEKHSGYIQYQTQRNRGTTFSVVLPRWTDDVSADSSD